MKTKNKSAEDEIKINIKKLSINEQYLIRRKIVDHKKSGKNAKYIAEALGVSQSHVYGTIAKYEREGITGIKPKHEGRKTGEKRVLNPAQEKEIQKLIVDKNPEQLKLKGFLWNRAGIAELIKRKYGLEMPLSTLGYYLSRWGFSVQRPCKVSKKQNPKQVQKWLDEEYPAIAQKAKNENAEIYWGDETGIQNTCNYVKGYAPIGKTPIIHTKNDRFKINMISAITNQGKLRFMLYRDSMTQQRLIDFMERLIKESARKTYLILDNLKVHHGKIVHEWLINNGSRIEVYHLPSYSPELNPDEYLNNHLKQSFGNRLQADSADDFENSSSYFLNELQHNEHMVRKYFNHPKVQYGR